MSVDPNCPPEMAAMFGFFISIMYFRYSIRWTNRLGVDVGRVNGEYVINPTTEQKKTQISNYL